jgi:hypothetical protein
MDLDLSSLQQEHSRWVRLGGALEGVEVQLRHRTMREREQFERRMISTGIMKKDGGVNQGRLSDFISAYTEHVIIGWRIPDRFLSEEAKGQIPTYQPEEMAKLLDASPASLDLIVTEVKDETAFFSQNGNGSPG